VRADITDADVYDDRELPGSVPAVSVSAAGAEVVSIVSAGASSMAGSLSSFLCKSSSV